MSQAHCQAFLSVSKDEKRPGNLMYVLIEDRAAFDLIDLPMTDHGPKESGHVLSKSNYRPGEQCHLHLIFQFWIEKPKL